MRDEIKDKQTDGQTIRLLDAFQAGGIKIKRSLWPTVPNILSWKHTGQWNVTGNTFFGPYHNNNNKLLAHRNITGSMQALICIE